MNQANDLTIAHTGYSPISESSPPLYAQNAYVTELLAYIANANPILKTLKIEDPKAKKLPHAASLTNLSELCLSAGSEKHGDIEVEPWEIFEAFWSDLTRPGRPPVLLALDGLSQVMRDTEYRNPDFELIHAHDFALIRWFMEHLSGARNLPNGGAVLAAMCASCGRQNHTLDARLLQLRTEQALAAGTLAHDPAADPIAAFLEATNQPSQPVAPLDPHVRWDQRVLEVLSGDRRPHVTARAALPSGMPPESISQPVASEEKETPGRDRSQIQTSAKVASPPYVLSCAGLDRDAARALMEYWARSGMLRAPVTTSLVAQHWTQAGGGVIGELERGCLKMRI